MENPSLPPYWQDYIHSLKNATNKHPDQIRYVVLDTETTGFNLRKDRILSIGALVLQNKEIKVNEAVELFIDQETFDASTVKIHGMLVFTIYCEVPSSHAPLYTHTAFGVTESAQHGHRAASTGHTPQVHRW